MESYPTPHLFGTIDYSGNNRFEPDGDTVHLLNPVLLDHGNEISPSNGQIEVWMPGHSKPISITVKTASNGTPYVPIRFEGIDAPEEHYEATPFELQVKNKKVKFPLNPKTKHEKRSQPLWKPATDYVLQVLEDSRYAVIELDREVVDKYGRVLGYVYSGDDQAKKNVFVTLELLKRGLAFPFVFESTGDKIQSFLDAGEEARKEKLGVWKHYQDKPLTYKSTFAAPSSYKDPEHPKQSSAVLNLPMVFRRIVDSHQLKGLTLKQALQKYDTIDYETGKLTTGDRFGQIPIGRRIWAPHSYK
jgi:endonuclease YncB( thermonuclease family)